MKIKSLLAAVSMVALSATAANAIVVTQSGTQFQAPLALELDLAATPATGTVTVLISPDNSGLFNNTQHNVVIDLPAGLTFDGTVPNGAITSNGAGGATGNLFTGGTDGTSSATFQITPPSSNASTITVVIPVQTSADYCTVGAGGGINAIVTTAGGAVNNDIDGDNTITGAPAIVTPPTPAIVGVPFGGCASAVSGTANPDSGDTFIAIAPTPTYSTIIASPSAAGTAGPEPIGVINYTVVPTVTTNPDVFTALAPADVLRVETFISLPGNPAMGGLSFVSPTPNGATIAPLPAGQTVTWRMISSGAQVVSNADTISVTAGGTVLPNIQPTVTNSVVTFVTATTPADFITSEPGATGNLDALIRQGETFGAFDWNSGPAITSPTLSVYRVTGLAAPTNYTIEVENSNNDGVYSGTVTPDATGEAVLVSTSLPVPADTGRYDFSINFETTNTAIDVDRLLLRSGIVSNFGDDANGTNPFIVAGGQPSEDADNDATDSE